MAKLYLVLFMAAAAAAGAASSPPACKTCDLCIGTLPPRGSDPPCTVPSSITNTYAACPAPPTPPKLACPCIPDFTQVQGLDLSSGTPVAATVDSTTGKVSSASTNMVALITKDGTIKAVFDTSGNIACDPIAISTSGSCDKVKGLCAGVEISVPSEIKTNGCVMNFVTAQFAGYSEPCFPVLGS